MHSEHPLEPIIVDVFFQFDSDVVEYHGEFCRNNPGNLFCHKIFLAKVAGDFGEKPFKPPQRRLNLVARFGVAFKKEVIKRQVFAEPFEQQIKPFVGFGWLMELFKTPPNVVGFVVQFDDIKQVRLTDVAKLLDKFPGEASVMFSNALFFELALSEFKRVMDNGEEPKMIASRFVYGKALHIVEHLPNVKPDFALRMPETWFAPIVSFLKFRQ